MIYSLNLMFVLFFRPCLDAVECLIRLLVTVEGRETDISLATWTEADTWGTDDAGAIEQILEELPGA